MATEKLEGRGASEVETQMQKKITELENRLREIEAARSSGLHNIRLILSEGDANKALVLEPPLLPAPATHEKGKTRHWEMLGALWGR